MSRNMFVRFAVWLIDWQKDHAKQHALAGDLLEELEAGRSMWWFCSEVLAAILTRVRTLTYRCMLLLAFSAGWSVLYPLWRTACVGGLAYSLDRFKLQEWPWSSLLPLIYGIVPALLFVWLGFVVYTTIYGSMKFTSAHEFACALSFSSCTLLVISLVVLRQLRHPQLVIEDLTRSDFFLLDHLYLISIPLTLSLMAALLISATDAGHNGHRRRVRWTGWRLLVSRIVQAFGFALSLCSVSSAQSPSAQTSVPPVLPTPAVQFVKVAEGVNLEVLDWGGTGRPMVFLAGLGNTAHTFDKFVPKITGKYHVYGITRRGFGASSKPAPTLENYSADRLGDDVLAVLDALKLDHPVLVGHSLAGEELSSIASRHPERVAGLIYLEAGYGYAFYDHVHGDAIFDFFQLQRLLSEYSSNSVTDPDHFTENLSSAVSLLDKDMKESQAQDPDAPLFHAPRGPANPIVTAINMGAKEYSKIPVPVLTIYACPHNFDFDPELKNNPKLKSALTADNQFYCSRQADAFAAGVPTARIVRIANADHYVFRSNEEQVLREMNAFLATLSY
jgi:non-heme chloroperoxidase